MVSDINLTQKWGLNALEVAEPGSAVADGLEVVDREINVSSTSHREQVQDGVGGTTDDVDESDSVDEGLARQDVLGL